MKIHGARGYSLIEVIVAASLLAVLALLAAPLLHWNQVNLTTADARSLLKQQAEGAIARMASNLREARRIYCREIIQFNNPPPPTIADNFSGSIGLAGAPAPLTGTVLPMQTSGAALTSGNALFFAKQLPSLDIPVGGGNVRIDLYQFFYYYVALDPAGSLIADQPARQLYEWRSVTYADINQINQIPGAADRTTVVTSLFAKEIRWAYDISLLNFNGAFFQLTNNGQIIAGGAGIAPMIIGSALTSVTKNSGGRIFSNFRLGVCPNTQNLGFATTIPVPNPQWSSPGLWTAPSPSGFEVVNQGSSLQGQRGNTLIKIRLVLAVSGPIERPILQYEGNMSVNIRDIW